jgi:phage terminase small subunit
MPHSSELNDQQASFVRFYCTGLSAQEAAQKAGYSWSYCRKASKLLKHPGIIAAIEESQASLRDSQNYGPAQAVAEIDRQIKMALTARSPNFMAAAKNLDLKCRIFGLVKEKVEVAVVDLRGSLEQAKARVINMAASIQSKQADGGAHWLTSIPGNPE